jgi:hypothetical protein
MRKIWFLCWAAAIGYFAHTIPWTFGLFDYNIVYSLFAYAFAFIMLLFAWL